MTITIAIAIITTLAIIAAASTLTAIGLALAGLISIIRGIAGDRYEPRRHRKGDTPCR